MALRVRGFVRIGAAMAGCALVVACTPEPSPTPTPTSTPASVTPTETEIERQQRLDYEAAETAYRSFRAEYDRVTTSTYDPRVTPKMRDSAGGPYLKAFAGFLETRREQQVQTSAAIKIGFVRRVGHQADQVRLQVCEDGSNTVLKNKAGRVVGKGDIGITDLTIRRVRTGWKVWDGDQREVATCES